MLAPIWINPSSAGTVPAWFCQTHRISAPNRW
jgi:hypothetical protein